MDDKRKDDENDDEDDVYGEIENSWEELQEQETPSAADGDEEFDEAFFEVEPFDELAEELEADIEDEIFALSDLDEVLEELSGAAPFGLDAMPKERRDVLAKRCPKCSITWDRLRQDGRAGCAHCYITFAEQLREVMQRVQHGELHRGKTPRAASKRRRRLEQLRAKRDNRLEMLNRRLQEAVKAENYEDAAKLRDQIKVVASTIVQPDEGE